MFLTLESENIEPLKAGLKEFWLMADSAVEIGLRVSPRPVGSTLNNNALLSTMMWPLLRETHRLDSMFLPDVMGLECIPNFLCG